jgi:hypothetical protein
MRKLYVVVPFFNPHQFKSRVRLYLQFKREMEAAGVQLLTVEAAFGEHAFQVTDPCDDWSLQLRTQHLIWHKERLINLGFQRLFQLVRDAWNIGWFDSDVSFVDADWVEKAVHKLMHCEVIQPFSQCIFLGKEEEELWHCPSTFSFFLEARGYHQRPPILHRYLFQGHPGLAWMATRRALDALSGVYDNCIAGSGDTVMANCLKGKWDEYLHVTPTPAIARDMQAWAARCDRHIDGRIGFTRGALLHHWHGPAEKRGYAKRWAILTFHEFDAATDLELDASGLYRLAGNKPQLRDDLRRSLSERNEDE